MLPLADDASPPEAMELVLPLQIRWIAAIPLALALAACSGSAGFVGPTGPQGLAGEWQNFAAYTSDQGQAGGIGPWKWAFRAQGSQLYCMNIDGAHAANGVGGTGAKRSDAYLMLLQLL